MNFKTAVATIFISCAFAFLFYFALSEEGVKENETIYGETIYGAKRHGGYHFKPGLDGEIVSDDDGCTFIITDRSVTFVGGCDFPSLLEK